MSTNTQENETKINTVQKKGEMNPKLSLSFKIFMADGQLFNYKTDNILTINHSTSNKCYYYCKTQGKNIIVNYEKHNCIQSNCDILFKARKSINGYYELISPIHTGDVLNLDNIENLNEKMWLVLPSERGESKYEEQNEQYHLQKNDIIKIGLKKYEIIEKNITISPKEINSKENKYVLIDGRIFQEEIKNLIVNINEDKSTEKYNSETDCRYCFRNPSTKENPLLKLCNCKEFTHLECLQKFLERKVKIKENLSKTVTSYTWEDFGCEVCKKPYPSKFKYKETNYNLFQYLIPPKETNYIIFESLPYISIPDAKDKNSPKNNKKNIHVVKLTGEDVKIGRNETNDLIDSEPTVSRFHGILKFNKENGFVTIINKGTFGILVLIKNNLKIEIGQTKYIQVGKTYIKAEVSQDEEKEIEKEKEKEKKEFEYEKKEINEELKSESDFSLNKTAENNQSEKNSMNINI